MKWSKAIYSILLACLISISYCYYSKADEAYTSDNIQKRLEALKESLKMYSYLNNEVRKIAKDIDKVSDDDIKRVIKLSDILSSYVKTEMSTNPQDEFYYNQLNKFINNFDKEILKDNQLPKYLNKENSKNSQLQSYNGLYPSPNSFDVEITIPHSGSAFPSGSKIMVSGNYTENLQDDIWVIVWPKKAKGRGWIQSDNAVMGAPATKKNGKWFVTCFLGDSKQSYVISVYTANKSASKMLGDTINEWYNNESYPGILAIDLPKGLTEKDRIQVRQAKLDASYRV